MHFDSRWPPLFSVGAEFHTKYSVISCPPPYSHTVWTFGWASELRLTVPCRIHLQNILIAISLGKYHQQQNYRTWCLLAVCGTIARLFCVAWHHHCTGPGFGLIRAVARNSVDNSPINLCTYIDLCALINRIRLIVQTCPCYLIRIWSSKERRVCGPFPKYGRFPVLSEQ